VDHDAENDALYEQIGRLKVELDWLKKGRSARLRSAAHWWSPEKIRRSIAPAVDGEA
jgi:hypothetical protein